LSNTLKANIATHTGSNNRFAALDGLRALAALGVLWIHTWTIHGNPRFIIGGFDITSLLALGGNGVDLFFVISGFCMYYFYANNKTFSYADFWVFIKKRWVRLSPAFYAACLVYIAIRTFSNPDFPFIKSALSSLVYLNGIFYTPENILWSLTAEWQFYLIVPVLLIYQNRLGFTKTFSIITGSMLILALLSIVILKSWSDIMLGQIMFRYFEFMWGILVGKILLAHPNFQIKHRFFYILSFVIITYAGRVIISKPILSLLPNYYNIFKLLGFTLMGLGFGGIVYMAVTSKHKLKLILGNKVLSFIGKISFSFYLWHGFVHQAVGRYVMATFPKLSNILAPLTTFFISVIILIPLSALSFSILEKPFMARNKKK
jgi:peptidoglycan/LPS O-acetylase OafA/YrhL